MMGSGELLKYAGRYLFGVTSLPELPVTASCVVRLQNKHVSPWQKIRIQSASVPEKFIMDGGMRVCSSISNQSFGIT